MRHYHSHKPGPEGLGAIAGVVLAGIAVFAVWFFTRSV